MHAIRARFLLPLLLLASAPLACFAQSASFNLPAAPLADSLKALGAQANINVLVTAALVDGKQAPALKANLSVKDALSRLLEGTGLEFHFVNDQTVVIREKATGSAGSNPSTPPKNASATNQEAANNTSSKFPGTPVDQANAEPRLEDKKQQSSAVLELAPIIVTGSRLHSEDNVSNVQVITAEDMARNGITSLPAALKSLPASDGILNGNAIGGNLVVSATLGAAGANLRGLGAGSTLVLLNGRRVVTYGYAAAGTSSFVDLNSLPFGAIDRIEVLKGGASAIYGSDAIAGVVNIILKPEYQGLRMSGDAGVSSRSDAKSHRVSGTGGFGSLQDNGYNFLFSADYTHSDPLLLSDRPLSSTADLRRFGLPDFRLRASPSVDVFDNFGSNANFLGTLFPCPAAQARPDGECVVDQNKSTQALPPQSSASLFATGSVDLGGHATLYSELGYSHNRTSLTILQSPQTIFLPSSSFQDGFPVTFTFPGSKTTEIGIGQYLPEEFGDRTLVTQSNNSRAVIGARGQVGNFSWDGAAIWNRGDATQAGTNFIRVNEFVSSIAGFSSPIYVLEPGKVPSAEERALFAPPFENRSHSTLTSLQGSLTGPLFTLPAGDVKLALGGELRREQINLITDPLVTSPDYLGVEIIQDVTDSRDVRSAYAELGAPLLSNLTLQLAGRYDSYSKAAQATRDPGAATTGKIGLRYEPVTWASLYAIYEQGFRAPSLFETSLKSAGVAQISNFDPVRCPVTGSPGDCGAVDGLYGANPDLRPEKSGSASLGLALRPVEHLQLTLDAYRIKRKNEIDTPSLDFLYANEALFPTRIVRGPPDIPGLPGPVTFLDIRYLNIGSTIVRGLDAAATYRHEIEGLGQIRGTFDTSYVDQFTQIPSSTAPPVSLAGFFGHPRLRATSSVGLDHGDFTTTLSLQYISSYKQALSDRATCQFATTAPSACTIGSFTTVNWTGAYHINDALTVGFTIENLLDRQPPFEFSFGNFFSTGLHDIRGRYYRLQLTGTL